MVAASAVPTSGPPRWICHIRLLLMGTQLTVGRGGGNNRNFYNPNYVYELDADGERMKDDKGMAVPLRELSDGVSVPVLVDSVDETLVSIQDKRREDLNAEISNLVREYDVRNKDRPDEARLYPLIWRLINGDFWDTAVAERLLVPSHEDHVSTLCAVWSLASHKFEWHRNQVWKGLRGFSKRAPNPIPTYDQTVTTIRIWIVTPTDFSKSPEGGYPSEEEDIWAIRPTRADPSDLTSPFTWGSEVIITVRGRIDIRSILQAFSSTRNTPEEKDTLPRFIIGYNDWDPAFKPAQHETLWPNRLVTGGYWPIGNQRQVELWRTKQQEVHRSLGKMPPDELWMAFVMPQASENVEDLSPAGLWPNLFKGYRSLARFMSENPQVGYHPERMPLLADHTNLTEEQRRAWGDHGPGKRGASHPPEEGPKPAGSYGEFFGKVSTAQMSYREQFYQQLDIDYEHQRSIKLGIMNAKREVTRYSLLEAKRRQFDQMLEAVRREIEENARALRDRIRQEEEAGESATVQLEERRQQLQSLELQHRARLADYDEEARRINTRLEELQSDLANSQNDLAEVIELCKVSNSATMTKEQLQERKACAIDEYKATIEEMTVEHQQEMARLRREHEIARNLLIASQRDERTALKSGMEQEMSLIRARGNDALETARKQIGRRLGRERQAAWDELVALSNKGPEHRQKVFNRFFSNLSVPQRSSLLSEWLVSGTAEAQKLQEILADPTSVEYTTLANDLFAQSDADTPAPQQSTSAPMRFLQSLVSRITRQKPQENIRGTEDEPTRALNRALLRKKWADEELQRQLAVQQMRDVEEQRRLDEEKKASIERGLLKLQGTLGRQASVVEAHQTHYNPGGNRFRKRGHSVGADWDISNEGLIIKRRRVGPASDIDPSEITFGGRE